MWFTSKQIRVIWIICVRSIKGDRSDPTFNRIVHFATNTRQLIAFHDKCILIVHLHCTTVELSCINITITCDRFQSSLIQLFSRFRFCTDGESFQMHRCKGRVCLFGLDRFLQSRYRPLVEIVPQHLR